MITIELANHVVRDFINMEKMPKAFNRHELHFDSFDIQFPHNSLRSEEELFNDTLKLMKEKQQNKNINGLGNELNNGNTESLSTEERKALELASKKISKETLGLSFHAKEEKATVTLKLLQTGSIFIRFSLYPIIPLPVIEENNCHTNPEYFARQLLNLMGNVVYYMEKPREEILVQEKREINPSKKKKKGKSGAKVYINKRIYRFIDTPSEASERQRHVESWNVRGHWRHYKDGRRVWVNAYVKGDASSAPQNKPYRIASVK